MGKLGIKHIVKRTLIVLLIALVAIQFFRPAKNNNPEISDKHLTKMYPVPDSVQVILQKACYDCHSNNTVYPWYSYTQPTAWWLNDHITEGKSKLNFSEFGTYPLLKQAKRLKKSSKEIDEGGMPLSSYTIIHRNAILTEQEKQVFRTWALGLYDRLYAQVPPAEIEADKKRKEEKKRKKEAEGK